MGLTFGFYLLEVEEIILDPTLPHYGFSFFFLHFYVILSIDQLNFTSLVDIVRFGPLHIVISFMVLECVY